MQRTDDPTAEREFRQDTLHAYRRGVERSIATMRERLDEPLSISTLAAAAAMSRFHFTRVFTQVTGVSPARFLAAVRMQEAKRLLLATDRSVTDVSLDVGYGSLGTFTRIFSEAVGLAPQSFRRRAARLVEVKLADLARLLPALSPTSGAHGVSGEVRCELPLSFVAVAMFRTALPKGQPLECVCLTDTRCYSFTRAPPPGAHLFAVGLPAQCTVRAALTDASAQAVVGAASFLRAHACPYSLALRPPAATDPPVVLAFPLLLLMKHFPGDLSIPGEACLV